MKKMLSVPLALFLTTTAVVAAVPPLESALVENMLCHDVSPEDAALFERYFGSEMKPVEKCWDAAALTEYSSFWRKNKAGKKVLCESIVQLAEDGSMRRRLWCERFENSDGKRVNYQERVQKAVAPFVFMSSLTKIVDFADETVYFEIVKYNPQTRSIEGVENKSWKRSELNATESLTDSDKGMFNEVFPSHKQRITPAAWDAEKRIVYSARGWSRSGLYELNGQLKWVAPNGSSCRIAHKALERRGKFKTKWQPYARTLKTIKPYLFLELHHGHELVVTLEDIDPQSGAWRGTRTRVYDFASLVMMRESTITTQLP